MTEELAVEVEAAEAGGVSCLLGDSGAGEEREDAVCERGRNANAYLSGEEVAEDWLP